MRTMSLVYTSRATQPVDMETLRALTEHAARKNAQLGITGLLLYGAGNFMQVLEGNPTSVNMLYDKIRKDNRHTACQRLCTHERGRRLFPDWNMGQLNLDNPELDPQSDWELIRATLSRSDAIDWHPSDPVLGWVRQFMAHNHAGGSGATHAA